MTLEELANRLDDGVAALERIAEALEQLARSGRNRPWQTPDDRLDEALGRAD